jgi:RimJ/RimL family protein N-acetyltransferase
MLLSNIVSRFRTPLTVYTHDFKSFGRALELEPDETFIRADRDSIAAYFSNDEKLAARFLEFVNAGFEGLFIVRGSEWVTYGWFSRPGRVNPPHLPRWTRKFDACWIFYCHTKSTFRGRGYFAKLLRQIVEIVRREALASSIYVDTFVTNFASRRAALAAGFVPYGLFTTYQLWIPLCGSLLLFGKWRRDKVHPLMEAPNPALAVTPLTQ